MAMLHLLGTGAAFSDGDRTTTMLAVSGPGSTVVIDCGGDVVPRLLAHGLELDSVAALIVTHEHADHVSGFPLMMERLWLAGRTRPLDVYGPPSAIAQVRRLHDSFDTSPWPGYPGVVYHEVDLVEGAPVFVNDDWESVAAPGKHAVPTMGVRIRDRHEGGVMAYSGDTEPAESIAHLASHADVLVHEATGDAPGHSSAVAAARIARRAGARRLVLVHLGPGTGGRAAAARGGSIDASLAHDGQKIPF